LDRAGSLPYASTLCGACFEACPVRIDIPQILIHLRAAVVEHERGKFLGALRPENLAMQAALWMFEAPGRLAAGQSAARLGSQLLARDGKVSWLPGALGGWTATRDFPEPPAQSFRQWWAAREKAGGKQ
jgi:L-lactate dehydrogenase complex protein LldF